MTRSTIALPIIVALAGCGFENNFAQDPPEFVFGNPPPIQAVTWTDEIVQVLTPKVDILWTIDNSCSMADEQAQLGESFPSFMNYFLGSGLDYHVGVTSTDIDGNYNGSKGKLRNAEGFNYLDENTPSPIDIFVLMATMGTTGSGTEKGLGGTYDALETNRDTLNAGFYRDEAAIHTIVITDEPDYTPTSVVTTNEFIDWYDGLKDDFDNRSFNTICNFSTGGEYVNVSKQIGGLQMDEASASWPVLLDRLGVQAAGFKREYFLSHLPVAETVHVSVKAADGTLLDYFIPAVPNPDTGVLEGDWTYDGTRNSITFVEYIPEALATVIINYELAAAVQQDDQATDTTPAAP